MVNEERLKKTFGSRYKSHNNNVSLYIDFIHMWL